MSYHSHQGILDWILAPWSSPCAILQSPLDPSWVQTPNNIWQPFWFPPCPYSLEHRSRSLGVRVTHPGTPPARKLCQIGPWNPYKWPNSNHPPVSSAQTPTGGWRGHVLHHSHLEFSTLVFLSWCILPMIMLMTLEGAEMGHVNQHRTPVTAQHGVWATEQCRELVGRGFYSCLIYITLLYAETIYYIICEWALRV